MLLAAPAAVPLSAGASVSATYYVGTTVDDAGTVSATTCATSTNTTCALRDAVAAANALASGDTATILFTPALSGHTVSITGSPVGFTGPATVALTGSDTSRPDTAATVIDGGRTTQLLNINSGAGPVTISNLTLQNGFSSTNGGALQNSATLNLHGVDVRDSAAHGTTVSNGRGGGVYNTGTLSVTGGSFVGNDAQTECGGAIDNSGTATISQVTIAKNSSDCGGGLMDELGGTMAVTASTIQANYARDYDDGGGVQVRAGTLSLINDTVVDNIASEYGGGVAVDQGGNATLQNVTISGNNALQGGGGIATNGGTVAVRGTVIAGNVEYGNVPSQCVSYGTLTDNGYNVVAPGGDQACTFTATGDKVADPQVQELRDNGGPTQTEEVAYRSPAIHLEPGTSCPATDQRGNARPQTGGSFCDAGAVQQRRFEL